MAASPRRATPLARRRQAGGSPLISAAHQPTPPGQPPSGPVARQDGTAQAQTRDGQHEQQAIAPTTATVAEPPSDRRARALTGRPAARAAHT